MLHCNMNTPIAIQLGLEDLLGDLYHARRQKALGRLALLAYCEVRGWARQAGKPDVAESATRMFTEDPCVSKEEFLEKIDRLITTLEQHQQAYQQARGRYSNPEPAVSPSLAQ